MNDPQAKLLATAINNLVKQFKDLNRTVTKATRNLDRIGVLEVSKDDRLRETETTEGENE